MGRLYYGDAPLYYGEDRLYYGEPYFTGVELGLTLDDALLVATTHASTALALAATLDDAVLVAEIGSALDVLAAPTLDDVVLVSTVEVNRGFSVVHPICCVVADAGVRVTVELEECETCTL